MPDPTLAPQPPLTRASLPECSWFVLHTKSRQEKILSQDLASREIRSFVPLIEKAKYYGKRKRITEEPLFPGYVFLLGTLEQAYSADRTKRVANIIKVADQDRIDWELINLQRAVQSRADLDPYPYLRKGVYVEIESGPFRGLQGMVEDRLQYDRLVLQVDILGRAVSLEIHGALVRPIDAPGST
jgi:transcription antitermination factor NusG